jgi:hypothetical protein
MCQQRGIESIDPARLLWEVSGHVKQKGLAGDLHECRALTPA